MDPIMLRQLQDVIGREANIGIITGKNPSIDEMGAALALYLSLSATGKVVSIASPSQPIVELSNLVGINKVKNRFEGGGGDLIVSFPYREGEIDKVSYTLENGYLNIHVAAGELGLNFRENEVKYVRPGGVPKVVIVIGSSRLSDLSEVLDPTSMKDSTVVNVDNKTDNQGYGDIVLVSQKISSVSEAVANIIQNLNLPLDKDIAQNLLSGISYATENFQNPSTSPLAFEMAGALIKQGANRTIGRRPEQPFDFGLKQQTQISQPQFNQPSFNQNVQESAQPFPAQPQQSQRLSEQKEAQKEEHKEDPFERLQKKLDEMKAKQSQETRQEPKKEMSQESQEQKPTSTEGTPDDWLTPKIYKGSTNF